MKLAISNIAWVPADDARVAAMMHQHGATGVEIAPTVVWPDPAAVSERDAIAYRRWWESRGLPIVAMQSLLFGKPDFVIFGSADARSATLDHLRLMCRIAGWIGASRLVFGSPANRRASHLPVPERMRIATDFFQRAGEAAAAVGAVLCLEPNPPQYGCDFINLAREGRELIARVASSGFGLHLDAGAMALQHESPNELADGGLPEHFHISEPFLAPLGAQTVDHAAFARQLRDREYSGWVSIEARKPGEGDALEAIARNLAFAMDTYF